MPSYDYDAPDGRPGCGEVALAAAIIARAVRDLRDGNAGMHETAGAFFDSDWFVILAEGCGLDPDAVRERLR